MAKFSLVHLVLFVTGMALSVAFNTYPEKAGPGMRMIYRLGWPFPYYLGPKTVPAADEVYFPSLVVNFLVVCGAVFFSFAFVRLIFAKSKEGFLRDENPGTDI